ncbi:MAG: hypothetical protein O3A02_03035 [bacterium]|nr:hypothetical protein [bacterium]
MRGLTHFAEVAEAAGRLDEARSALADAFGIAEALGDRHRVDQVVTALQSVTDDPEEREGWYRVGAAERRRTGNVVHEIVSLADQASFTAHTFGEYGGALALVDRAVALERRQDWSPMRLAPWLQLAAEIRIAAGDLEAAAVAAVTPGSEAGRTLVGELLRSEMARVRGRTVSALGCADQALVLVPLPRAGRRGHRERVMSLLAATDCALAQALAGWMATALSSPPRPASG